MAIDDNTSYELTGAQVKDLANKIKAKAADNIFVGATSAIPGSKGLVPAPQAGDDTKFLSGNGLWTTVSQYSLPIASSSTLGGIKVGNNLTIDPLTGVLDADGSTYTAGNAIDITNDVISADIYPADYFTAGETVTNTGSSLTLNGTIEAKLNNIELYGDTAQQTYTGKNLYNKDGTNILSAYIDFTHQSITSIANNRIIWIKCKPSTTYTVSKLPMNNQRGIAYTTELPAVGVQTYGYRSGANGWSSLDFTTGADAEYLVIRIWSSAQDTETLETMLASVQIEEGSTATSYEPYVGGVPSPNPDYPQDVNVVTGSQTFTITNGANVQTYPITLGSIELAKIGDYQDYIYQSGDDWYVRKEVGKSTLGTLNWSYSDTGTANVYRMYTGGLSGQYVAPADNSSIPSFVCTHFIPTNANESYSCKTGIASNRSGSAIYCYDPDYNTTSSPAGFKTWLSNNDVTLYYALATPTDTKITDATLISQLNALYNATSYEAQTNFEVTATSPNLPAILGVSAYKKSLEGTLGAIASKPNQDTTYSDFTGATSGTAGAAGLVPAPSAGDQDKVLSGAGTWVAQSGGGSTYTAGNHIDITNDVISAEGYIWGDDAAPASTPASTITSAMIVDGTIQATDIATGVVPIITMTDTDPGEGSPLAANNFVAVYGEDTSNMNYSLTEAKTGATWIDGSPIYKKTINVGALPNNTTVLVNHNISNIGTIIEIKGTAYESSSTNTIPLPYAGNTLNTMVKVFVTSSVINIWAGSDRSSFSGYVTLYYTKSS